MSQDQIAEHKIEIARTAHYYSYGTNNAKNVWIVLHGYGQLASRIIQKFNEVSPRDNFVIAPEGLSKFYYSRNPEVLGASWMTKHKRLDEIADYLKYLDQIYDLAIANCPEANVHVLGFSQGNATLWRWIAYRQPMLQSIIMWAGEFPPEPDYKSLSPYINSIPNLEYCVGNQDEFVTDERLDAYQRIMKEASFSMNINRFEGGHRIDRNLLNHIVSKIN